MPGPEANTEYHCVAFATSFDFPKLCHHDVGQRLRNLRIARAQQAVPVRVHAFIERLVIEQLRSPFGGVDLGDLGRDHQPRRFEQLIGRNILVSGSRASDPKDCAARCPQFGFCGGLPAELIHKRIVFAREQVVIETHPDGPVIRESRQASWPAHCG